MFGISGLVAETYIINTDGEILAGKMLSLNKTIDVGFLNSKTRDKGEDVFLFSDYNGVKSVGVYSSIDEAGWFVISEVNDELLTELLIIAIGRCS